MLLEYFGFKGNSAPLASNGDTSAKVEAWHSEPLGKTEATAYRGLAARLNYMSQDCPDLQFPIKEVSRDMASPTKGSWLKIKKGRAVSIKS